MGRRPCGAPAFSVPFCCARKPRGYWLDTGNLLREVAAFHASHGGDARVLPTAGELLRAGRADLYRAVQRQGGFARCAQRIGLAPARHPRGYWARALPRELAAFAQAHGVPPGRMPSTTALRLSGRTDILNAVQAAGGVRSAASTAGLCPVSPPAPTAPPRARELPPPLAGALPLHRHARLRWARRSAARPRTTWREWPALCAELRGFAERQCGGRMPLQRELAAAGRHDLINAVRARGGLAKAAALAGLRGSAAGGARRPRGYWSDAAVLEAEMRAYTAEYGVPGLMPRRDQLLRAGRRDLCYAVEKHGGFSAVSARLHLVWVGPSNFWRVFRNLRKRLLQFVRKHGPRGIMPTVLRLHQMGRIDLVYGVALHGGVMVVAEKVGLRVRYARRRAGYWENPKNITKELEWFMQTQPLENRQSMPSSVALVQAGRADLANGVRDHGGWVYYAQLLGLRFAFARRVQGFWQNEDNVLKELMFYVSERYGTWEHPGRLPENMSVADLTEMKSIFVPSVEMLKRDGRSDIAFAVQRYQGGENAFAKRHSLAIAKDIVHVQPIETMQKWLCFVKEMEQWIQDFGADGIMPKREDFIRTGRHDLRYAMFMHGGSMAIAKRIGLIFCHESSNWIASWLALQAGRLGTVLSFEEFDQGKNAATDKGVPEVIEKLNKSLSGCTLGNRCKDSSGKKLKPRKTVAFKAGHRRKKKKTKLREALAPLRSGERKEQDSHRQITLLELDALRKRYEHLRSDDIITP